MTTRIFLLSLLIAALFMAGACKPESPRAKNVIVLIGDGMGTAQITAAIVRNKSALNLQRMPVAGFSKTWSASDLVTDSGAGGTALACGERTYNGAIGVSTDSTTITNITEILGSLGFANGIAVTCAITHATPASFYAHQTDRNRYEKIAQQLHSSAIQFFAGGGRNHFDMRTDSVNYIDSLTNAGFRIVSSPDSIGLSDEKIGLFYTYGHPASISEGRGNILVRSVEAGIRSLSKNPKGFFLMAEGSQIDWGGHANDIDYVTAEMLDFDQAIGAALDFAARDKNTLVIVTADHETGGLSITDGSLDSLTIRSQFATDQHSAAMVPIFAYGPGAEAFGGIHENIDIFRLILKALGVE